MVKPTDLAPMDPDPSLLKILSIPGQVTMLMTMVMMFMTMVTMFMTTVMMFMTIVMITDLDPSSLRILKIQSYTVNSSCPIAIRCPI